MHFGIGEIWQSMGPVARLVVALLAMMSIGSVAIAVDRLWFLVLADGRGRAYAEQVAKLAAAGRLSVAADLDVDGAGSYGRVMTAGLAHYRSHHRGAPDTLAVAESLDAAFERALSAEGPRLRRGLGALATIGSTAPFVGLFGTVVGIINAFSEIAITGAGGMETVSGGIAEALVATALGILVAVPAVVFFNAFSLRVETIEMAIADLASALVDAVRRQSWSDARSSYPEVVVVPPPASTPDHAAEADEEEDEEEDDEEEDDEEEDEAAEAGE
jgi:biopolymer transport protein ExbB/biopolymer transport protein TolQ